MRKEKQMDYINKIKTIASGAVIAVVACTTIAMSTADKAVTNSQNVSCTTEESSSDDGSAPGPYLSNVEVNTSFVQSAVIDFDCTAENETENETQILAEEETIEEEVIEQPVATAQGNESHQVAEPEYVLEFSEEDYQVLCKIVEAEAGDQDAKGRILVTNVIINRVKTEGKYGNTIKEVVFANNGKTYQFSPTKPGGSYYNVTASELTIECVDRALRGEDYSEGALYFCMKTSSNSWFNTSLQFLFKHQDHYFYK